MATYPELRELRKDKDLAGRVEVATQIAADMVKSEDDQTANHANRLVWARDALSNPERVGGRMFDLILVQNKSATVTAIEQSTDAVLQTAVDDAVDFFAG